MSTRNRVKIKAPKPFKRDIKKAFAENPLHRPKVTFRGRVWGVYRRVLRIVFHPITISVFILGLLALGLTVMYFWNVYSEKVDQLLSGEIFTKNAGVFSAPKNLKVGESSSQDDLVEYLKSAGYIEKNQQADSLRSRYLIGDNALEIEPGETAT